ncbi:MAG TPA: type II and III secretion system protein family protein [Roseiarcus sp.]|nr:type II and III secretion system protein family protein [Roseiarcus sp.]
MRFHIEGKTLCLIGAAAAMLAMAPPERASAAGSEIQNGFVNVPTPSPIARRLQMGVGKSIIIDLPADAGEIFVGDPQVANAVVRSAHRLYVAAIANGQTTIFAMGRDGRQIAVLEVSVGRDVGELQDLLRVAIPTGDISVKTVSDTIILMGSVASAGDAQKAIDIAQGFVGTSVLGGGTTGAPTSNSGSGSSTSVSFSSAGVPLSGKVINSLIIRGLDQVSVKVTVAEIRRDIAKQLGVSLNGVGNSPNTISLNPPFTINGALAQSQGVFGWMSGGKSLTATVQAFEQNGVARTLAEPTVTAISGESAKFLAGGEIPVPAGESCQGGVCSLTFTYEPVGVSLNFTPVILSPGRIQLRIATEVTDINREQQLTVSGTTIPAFDTRKNETTVELPSGGSIVSAGLLSTQTQQSINGVPGLMDLPILGALFRSRDYLRNDTELMIIVTPYIVHAVDPGQVVKPTDNFVEATDPQAWLLGRVNRLYSSAGAPQNLQNYTGKVGFIND